MKKIELDKSSFKALSSESRLKIIKILNNKDMRVTDIAEEIDLSKPTVSEHLKKLEKSELIKRKREDKKWVYYGLTDKAKSLLEPQMDKRIKILITTSIISFIGGIWSLLNNLFLSTSNKSDIMIKTAQESSKYQELFEKLPWEGILLIIISIGLIMITLLSYKRKKII